MAVATPAERITEIINKLPLGLFAFLYIGYLAFDYYTFLNDDQSPLVQKRGGGERMHTDNLAVQTKIKNAAEFMHNLEGKKAAIRGMATDLDSMKETLSENIDVGEFMRLVVTEAKKVGLTVRSLKPKEAVPKEFYVEQVFEMEFQGVYAQLLVFLERLSNVQRIIRVDDFSIVPKSSSSSKYVEIEGKVLIKTYKYLGSKADDIAKSGGTALAAPGAKNATPPAPNLQKPGGVK